jgi:hypothetical protein
MADIIQIKRSVTSGSEPGAGSLSEGELAINIADKKGWIGDTLGDPILIIDNGQQVINATDVVYDNTSSGLTATDVQAAIDEVLGVINNHKNDTNNPHQTSWSNLGGIPSTFPPSSHGHDGGTF